MNDNVYNIGIQKQTRFKCQIKKVITMIGKFKI